MANAGDGSAFPPDATAALTNLFFSATEIEVVLLLEREPLQRWDDTTVARALRLSREHSSCLLESLVSRGFLQADGPGYRYAPATLGLAAAVRQIAGLRPGERVAAIGLVFSSPRGPITDYGRRSGQT